jgi:hypothetical protein
MAARPQSLPKREKKPSYRCPGCGESFDGTDLALVREHHEHVRYPRPQSPFWSHRSMDAAASSQRRPAEPVSRSTAEADLLQDAERLRRRYGHFGNS